MLRKGSQIIGVYSQAGGEPFRRAQFDAGLESFEGARSYAQWQFIFVPRTSAGARPATDPVHPTPSSP